MSDINAAAEATTETAPAPAKPTKFGGEILATVRTLNVAGTVTTVAEIASALGKAANIVTKSIEKLVKDGHLTVAGEGEAATYAVTETGEAVSADVKVEPKAKESAKSYKFVRSPEKGPKQMLEILKTIEESEGSTIGHTALMEKLGTVLVTRQSPARVFQFYRAQMVEGGMIEVLSA